MRPLAEHLAAYAAYHRDPRNRLTHFFGVPAIILAVLVLLALVRGTIGGIEISLAMVFVATMTVYYLLLDHVIGLALAVLVAPLLVRIPTMSAGHSELKSATCSDSSRPAIPIDVGRGDGSPAGRW